jgi:hypothetical protein
LSIKNCSWLATKEHVPIMVMIDSNYMLFSSGTQQFVNSSDEEKKFGTSRHKKPIKASAGKNLRISWCGCVECTYCTKQKSEFLGGTIFLFFHFIFVLYLPTLRRYCFLTIIFLCQNCFASNTPHNSLKYIIIE